jgi:hypothetical protein
MGKGTVRALIDAQAAPNLADAGDTVKPVERISPLQFGRATPVLDGVKGAPVAKVMSEVCRIQHGGRRASDESVFGHGTVFFPDFERA